LDEFEGEEEEEEEYHRDDQLYAEDEGEIEVEEEEGGGVNQHNESSNMGLNLISSNNKRAIEDQIISVLNIRYRYCINKIVLILFCIMIKEKVPRKCARVYDTTIFTHFFLGLSL
jgi:hypothetical protein